MEEGRLTEAYELLKEAFGKAQHSAFMIDRGEGSNDPHIVKADDLAAEAENLIRKARRRMAQEMEYRSPYLYTERNGRMVRIGRRVESRNSR